ncbi:ionotropic receptor 75a-like [Melitaea cinxia]|uniref:ionotropic receptor 75a-like n=1 Tax=Melitaea cinxia TaxID=113334 RepID=UPI001E26F7BE|nr:ionotropic receptor 75a-like [Melitaea cinxia]
MLTHAIAALFKFKVVGSIITLACWPASERVKFARELFKHDLMTSFSCGGEGFDRAVKSHVQGVLYVPAHNNTLNEKIVSKVNPNYFSHWYKWVVVGEDLPEAIKTVRYDADILLIRTPMPKAVQGTTKNKSNTLKDTSFYIQDIYIHPLHGASAHPWGVWDLKDGIQATHGRDRILRRQNLRKYPLKIATPLGSYSEDTYNGTFLEYLMDMSIRERDSGVRSGYGSSALIIEMLNATEIIVPTMLWSTEVNNSSMMLELKYGRSDLGGGILRMMPERFAKLDYVSSIWPFHVGFTYLAERESSSNMFLEPFAPAVWWCCLCLFLVLALAQRVTAKTPMEKEGAYAATLATFLQQDASAVPEGISGRWNFLVLSISAMLIHAYYTSAIVSALMSAGRSGPDSLRSLGDSKYAIASEDYDYMRYLMFDVETNREDLEYLKKKKLTSRFYQDIHVGVSLIQDGQTAFHTEYNQLYPHLKTFTDDQLCKLQYIDTIPEILTWITTTKHGQWTNTFRVAGARLHETGHIKRLVSRLRIKPPPCRAALLAERVNIGDVAPVLILTLSGAAASLALLGMEIVLMKWIRKRNVPSSPLINTIDI